MATLTKTHPAVGPLVDEMRFVSKALTMISVDWDVDADASAPAMEAVLNSIQARGHNILAAGAVYDTGTKQDFLLEGAVDEGSTAYTSADGTVNGTFEQAMVEDIINLGTVDGVNFASGTVAVTQKATFKYA